VWARGLKHLFVCEPLQFAQSRPVWARGLKLTQQFMIVTDVLIDTEEPDNAVNSSKTPDKASETKKVSTEKPGWTGKITDPQIQLIEKLFKHWKTNDMRLSQLKLYKVAGFELLTSVQASSLIKNLQTSIDKDHAAEKANETTNQDIPEDLQ